MTLRSSRAATSAIVFYHGDHLQSTAVLSDAEGRLLEETSYYPYGGVRHGHRPGGDTPSRDYAFTGKERDSESGLHYMKARYFTEHLGVFASPDPRFVEIAILAQGDDKDQGSFRRFLENPQMGNVYAYGLRNPIKLVDPNGLEVVLSRGIKSVPAFNKAWKLFKSTKEGKRILKSIEDKGGRVYIRASRVGVRDAKVGTWTTALGQEYTGPAEGKNLKVGEAAALINIDEHVAAFKGKALVDELAVTIHHELRHAEVDFDKANLQKIENAAAYFGLDRFTKTAREVHQDLDRYNRPSDDPFNAAFEKEIGLVK